MNETVAAIIPAAGQSTRMGELKSLLPLSERPMLARVVETLRVAEVAPIIVVTGHAREAIETALREYSVCFAHNDLFASGEMLSSVQAGARALPENIAAFLLMPGDQPLVQSATICSLIENWRASRAAVVSPVYRGKKGHPVLFDVRCRAEILALPDGATLRDVVHRHEVSRVEVEDEGVVFDVDTPDDYERALAMWKENEQ